jgi:CubicO group peptidase (beta-lactamase class C family)
MREQHIPGVIVAVVHQRQEALVKGYGIANARGDGVNPARTMFRLGSISKTFTWIALLQLVEGGKVALDKPVNLYLPVALRIPDVQGRGQILVRHLLGHDAGFEDLVAGLFLSDPA